MSSAQKLRALYLRSGVRRIVPMRAKLGLRKVWARTARRIGYPISSPALPRPPLHNGRRRMRLTHVLLASNLNPDYLEFWPVAKRAWREIAELEPVLVVIGDAESLPPSIRADAQVQVFEPVGGVHSSFQAQCIRLLYPALLETPGAVVISDIDMLPMSWGYLHASVAKLDESYFIAYRDLALGKHEIPISFNAARPGTWGEIFRVQSLDDVGRRLVEWWAEVEYDGARGGAGWNTDQRILYETVMKWGAATRRLWILDDDFCGYRRLDRRDVTQGNGVAPGRRSEIRSGRYSDYHCLAPYRGYEAVTDLVLELGIEAAVRTRGRRAPRVS